MTEKKLALSGCRECGVGHTIEHEHICESRFPRTYRSTVKWQFVATLCELVWSIQCCCTFLGIC